MKRMRLLAVASGAVVALLATVAPAPGAGAVNYPLPTVVSANPADNTPHVLDGKVFSIAEVGTKVVVAGTFTRVRNANQTTEQLRKNVFAYDRVTGVIDQAFQPVLNGVVNAVEPSADGTAVFLGGAFTNVNGVVANRLTKVSIANGALVTAFKAPATAAVWDIELNGTTLYVVGAFQKLASQNRALLGAVDAVTGKIRTDLNVPLTVSITGTPSAKKLDVTPDGSRLVVIGNFQYAGGVYNRQIAMIDLTTSPDTLANWHTNRYEPRCSTSFDTYMRGIDFSPDGSYFVAVTTGAGFADTLCDTAARFETFASGTNLQPTWVNYTGGDTLYSVAITPAAVYIGGHQRWMNNRNGAADVRLDGGVARSGVAALDPLTGLPLTWNPGRTRGVGAQELIATANGLYIGSDTTSLGGEYHGRLGFFPVAGGTENPLPRATTLPADLFRIAGNGAMDRTGFDGTTFGGTVAVADGVDWSNVRGAFMANGQLYAALSDGTLRRYSWNGAAFVSPVTQPSWTSFSSVRSLSYQNGRLFFSYNNDSRLYWRWFSLESGIVGSEQFVADSGASGVDWGDVVSATVAGGFSWVGSEDGRLTRVTVDVNGMPQPGTAVDVSGPQIDGRDWDVIDTFAWSA